METYGKYNEDKTLKPLNQIYGELNELMYAEALGTIPNT